MSNEIQKLKPVERSLYRRVFMAAIDDRQSVEAAHKRGLHAVKLWNEAGAFNEEHGPTVEPAPMHRYAIDLYETVLAYTSDETAIGVETDRFEYAVLSFVEGKIDLADFRRRLGLDRGSSG